MVDISTKIYTKDKVFILLSIKITFNTLFNKLDSIKAY